MAGIAIKETPYGGVYARLYEVLDIMNRQFNRKIRVIIQQLFIIADSLEKLSEREKLKQKRITKGEKELEAYIKDAEHIAKIDEDGRKKEIFKNIMHKISLEIAALLEIFRSLSLETKEFSEKDQNIFFKLRDDSKVIVNHYRESITKIVDREMSILRNEYKEDYHGLKKWRIDHLKEKEEKLLAEFEEIIKEEQKIVESIIKTSADILSDWEIMIFKIKKMDDLAAKILEGIKEDDMKAAYSIVSDLNNSHSEFERKLAEFNAHMRIFFKEIDLLKERFEIELKEEKKSYRYLMLFGKKLEEIQSSHKKVQELAAA